MWYSMKIPLVSGLGLLNPRIPQPIHMIFVLTQLQDSFNLCPFIYSSHFLVSQEIELNFVETRRAVAVVVLNFAQPLIKWIDI